MPDCRWCAHLRRMGASEDYVAEQHASADDEYAGHVAPDDAVARLLHPEEESNE